MLFSMVDGQREIPCAISTSAMDHLESRARSQPNQREAAEIDTWPNDLGRFASSLIGAHVSDPLLQNR